MNLFNGNRVSHRESECIFGWWACFDISKNDEECILNVVLKIKLEAAEDVTQAEIDAGKALWEPAIEQYWHNKYYIVLKEGECPCEVYNVHVDVQFVTSGEHHTVLIERGPGRENMTRWFHDTNGATAAHEAGHMFGNIDEYADPDCPNRTVTNDGSLMQTTAGTVKKRHYHEFAEWISRETCSDYEVGDSV